MTKDSFDAWLAAARGSGKRWTSYTSKDDFDSEYQELSWHFVENCIRLFGTEDLRRASYKTWRDCKPVEIKEIQEPIGIEDLI